MKEMCHSSRIREKTNLEELIHLGDLEKHPVVFDDQSGQLSVVDSFAFHLSIVDRFALWKVQLFDPLC